MSEPTKTEITDCAECKHFVATDCKSNAYKQRERLQGLEPGTFATRLGPIGSCGRITNVVELTEHKSELPAIESCGCCGGGTLVVAADFGCKAFEPKAPA